MKKKELKMYEVDVLVSKVVREVNEGLDKRFDKRNKRKERELLNDLKEFEKEVEEIKKKREKLVNRGVKLNEELSGRGYCGVCVPHIYEGGCDVNVNRVVDYNLERKVREEIVLWSLGEGDEIEKLCEGLVKNMLK